MNRWIISLSLALLVACQTTSTETTETNDVEQAVSNDCVPGGNFLGTTTGPLPLWNGQKPVAAPGQIFLDVADWRKSSTSSGVGFHVAVLADPGTGKIVWGATVPDGKLATFRASNPGVQPMVGDCCRPPPCGCRGCCDDWMAPNLLEAALRYVEVPANAAAAAGPASGFGK